MLNQIGKNGLGLSNENTVRFINGVENMAYNNVKLADLVDNSNNALVNTLVRNRNEIKKIVKDMEEEGNDTHNMIDNARLALAKTEWTDYSLEFIYLVNALSDMKLVEKDYALFAERKKKLQLYFRDQERNKRVLDKKLFFSYMKIPYGYVGEDFADKLEISIVKLLTEAKKNNDVNYTRLIFAITSIGFNIKSIHRILSVFGELDNYEKTTKLEINGVNVVRVVRVKGDA